MKLKRWVGAGLDCSAVCCLPDCPHSLLQIHHYLGHSYIALKDVHRTVQPEEAADSSAGGLALTMLPPCARKSTVTCRSAYVMG